MPAIVKGAALQFTENELGGPCVENESYPSCQFKSTVLAQGNADRVGLVIMNLGSVDIFVAIGSGLSATQGIRLGANGGVLSLSVRDDFTLPTREFDGFSSGIPATCYVLEIIRFRALTVDDGGNKV